MTSTRKNQGRRLIGRSATPDHNLIANKTLKKMKTQVKISILVILLTIAGPFVQAQNYKAPKIDAAGKITDMDGNFIGRVTKDGVITNAKGVMLGHVDGSGNLINEKTGEKLGKAEKNGNFLRHFAKTSDKGWTVSTPENGTCYIKDKDGNIKAEVHENYKAFGACAIHCLSHHMNHTEVRDEKKLTAAAYACPMHADETSEHEGKCSQCGMDLKKKN